MGKRAPSAAEAAFHRPARQLSILEKNLLCAVNLAITTLPHNEATALKMRLGLVTPGDNTKATYSDIGKVLNNVGRARAQAIYNRAVDRLKQYEARYTWSHVHEEIANMGNTAREHELDVYDTHMLILTSRGASFGMLTSTGMTTLGINAGPGDDMTVIIQERISTMKRRREIMEDMGAKPARTSPRHLPVLAFLGLK